MVLNYFVIPMVDDVDVVMMDVKDLRKLEEFVSNTVTKCFVGSCQHLFLGFLKTVQFGTLYPRRTLDFNECNSHILSI